MIESSKKILLWACVEDYAGLWELRWEINSKFPDLPEPERKRLSIETVLLLLGAGLIKLYRCQEPYGELSELDTNKARIVLSEEKYWEAPESNSVSIRAGATEEGEKSYQNM